MDYKSVVEEQIRELQEVQNQEVKNGNADVVCKIAETIANLCEKLSSGNIV